MQQSVRPNPRDRHRFSSLAGLAAVLTVAAVLACLAGCPEPNSGRGEGRPPHADVALTVRCPDAALADTVEPMVRAWAARTGASVTLKREAMTPADDSDVGVIPATSLGEWADPGHLAPLPAGIRAGDHPFQWSGVLAPYREQLVSWGGQAQAVPLTGDGSVIVYRADRFGDKTAAAEFTKNPDGRIAAPATWEDFADVAAFFARRDGKPSLPPLPADPDRLFDLFCRVAACFDRKAMSELELGKLAAGNVEVLAFHHSLKDGTPRLDKKDAGFAAAAKWLSDLHKDKCLPPGGPDDPVAALAEGRAVMAVLSLDQLARLPRENGVVAPRFALSAVPGAGTLKNPGGPQPTAPNYVPYFAGGRVGVVRARCEKKDAAFELLAELGGPARSAELVATPGLGAGPFRVAHLDRDRLAVWLGYAFDQKRSEMLQDLMRQYVGQAVKNPAFALRGPDRAALTAAGADAVRKIGTGALPPDKGLAEAARAWEAIDAKTHPDTRLQWRKRAAGLN
jgi:ABC-type glycerol-3-phosphate transport system substrate-binding protein